MVQFNFTFLRIDFYLCNPDNGYRGLLAALTITARFRLGQYTARTESDSPCGFEKTATVEFHSKSPNTLQLYHMLIIGNAARLCYAIGQVRTCQIMAGQIETGIDSYEKAKNQRAYPGQQRSN